MITVAPAWAAPWTAFMPMPPTPMTITMWPGWTSAEFTAEPVPTPQLVSEARSNGMSGAHFTAESTETVEH
jgi:hypothetical protein